MLMLAFLPADSELLESHWLNRMAAKVAPSGSSVPKIHVELLFANNSDSEDICGKACSIHYNGEVFFEPKRFSRKQWQFRQLRASEEQIKKAKNFCMQHVGDKFNHVGYFLQPFCKVSPHTMQKYGMADTPRWYCSEIVSSALHWSGIDEDIPVSCHPEKLFQLTKQSTAPSCPRNTEIKF